MLSGHSEAVRALCKARTPSSLAVCVIPDLTKVKVGRDMPGHAAGCWRMPLA
jgi:hypothetical protein